MLKQDAISRAYKLFEILCAKDITVLWQLMGKYVVEQAFNGVKSDDSFGCSLDVIAEDLGLSFDDVMNSIEVLSFLGFLNFTVVINPYDTLILLNWSKIHQYCITITTSVPQLQNMANEDTSDKQKGEK